MKNLIQKVERKFNAYKNFEDVENMEVSLTLNYYELTKVYSSLKAGQIYDEVRNKYLEEALER